MSRSIRTWLGTALALSVVGAAVLVGGGSRPAAAAARPGGGDVAARLAAELGLPTQQVEAAVKAALTGMVDDALAAGRIGPRQAEAAKARIAQGRFGLHPHLRRHPGHAAMRHGLARAAEVLDIPPAQLRQELAQGRTLAAVAAARGVTREQLVEALLQPLRHRLDTAAAAGRLSAEQAQRRLDAARERVERMLDRTWTR